MVKGPKGEIRPKDSITNAVHIAKIATGEIEDTEQIKPTRKQSKSGFQIGMRKRKTPSKI